MNVLQILIGCSGKALKLMYYKPLYCHQLASSSFKIMKSCRFGPPLHGREILDCISTPSRCDQLSFADLPKDKDKEKWFIKKLEKEQLERLRDNRQKKEEKEKEGTHDDDDKDAKERKNDRDRH